MNNDDIQLMGKIYQNAQMGIETLNTIRKNTIDENLKQVIDKQILAFEDYKQNTQNIIRAQGEKEKSVNVFASSMSKMNINVSSTINPDTDNIANIMIKGTQMGIQTLAQAMNKYNNASPEIMQMAADLMNYEKNNISVYNDFV